MLKFKQMGEDWNNKVESLKKAANKKLEIESKSIAEKAEKQIESLMDLSNWPVGDSSKSIKTHSYGVCDHWKSNIRDYDRRYPGFKFSVNNWYTCTITAELKPKSIFDRFTLNKQ